MPGKANVLADFNSRVPISDFGGLADDDAFDIARHIPPTSAIYTALQEWRAQYDARLKAKRCPAC